jgi:hypothetical protein
MGITVIMASYLGEYLGSRTNPVQKFIRAVKSFQQQTLKEKQLIIISDGCGLTNATYEDLFKSDSQITLIRFEKQEGWPGPLREAARSIAKYEWIMYLDTDDFFLEDFIQYIIDEIKQNKDKNFDIIRLKKFLYPLQENPTEFDAVFLKSNLETLNKISNNESLKSKDFYGEKFIPIPISWGGYNATCQIIHKNELKVKWEKYIGIEGGEDSIFIQKLSDNFKSLDLDNSKYVIGHYNYKSKEKIIQILNF